MNKNINGNKANDLVEHANRKLRALTKDGFPVSYENVRMSADVDEDTGCIVVTCGSDELAAGGFQEVKDAVWKKVDAVRDEVNAISGSQEVSEHEPVREEHRGNHGRAWLSDFDFLMKIVNETVQKANEELASVVGGGYPFTMDRVEMSVTSDSAGLYVHSGKTPVISVPRARSEGTLRAIKSEIWGVVNSTKATVERRIAQKADADALASEDGDLYKAAEALRAAGLDASILGAGKNLDAAKSVASAAQKAVKDANRGIYLMFDKACDALYGGYKGALMAVKGYAGGIVVLAGGVPCLVTRFPKVANNATVERTADFVSREIMRLGESRRRYLSRVQKDMETEELMHQKAAEIDAANEAIAAAM